LNPSSGSTVLKSGYNVDLAKATGAVDLASPNTQYCNNPAALPASAYGAAAAPSTPGGTGTRYFGTDTRGTIFQSNSAAFTPASIPSVGHPGSVSSRLRISTGCRRLACTPFSLVQSSHSMSKTQARLALVCASVGLAASAYAAYVHYHLLYDPNYRSLCDVSATVSCTTVYQSRFSTFRGIQVALLGGIWFAVAGLLALGGLTARDTVREACPAISSSYPPPRWRSFCISATRRSS
jgi:hypothetical protein